MANAITWFNDSNAVVKRVYYEGSSTIREGMPLCYNFDTTDNWTGYGAATLTASRTEQGTTAEGEQNEGKYIRVEDPSSTNFQWLAGYVAGTERDGESSAGELDIYVPNGAIVPVRTDADCTAGVTMLGLADGEVVLQKSTGDDDPIACAIPIETVDRSSVAGLVLAKIFPTGQLIVGNSAYFLPSTYRNGRCYGFQIDGTNFFAGAAAAQEYLVMISGDKDVATTGDGYGGLVYIQGNVDAANDSNYTFRGLNVSVDHEENATLGHLYGANVSISLKGSSGNLTTAIAQQIDAQDLTSGTKTTFGGLDISLNREGTAATEEFGVRVRTRGTINTAMNTVFRIDKGATDHGFVNLFNIESDAVDYAACTGDVTVDANDKVIPVVLGGTTYYLIAVDSIPAV